MKKSLLYGVVFISGSCILALEIIGVRILGPFYGVSIYLWSAIIGITLLSLSLGYFIGGRWADKSLSFNNLSYAIAAAGVWILFIPLLKYPILNLTEPWGLRLAVLFASIVLFAPPLTLLGIVSPYAIKLKTDSLGELGKSAGYLYAVSTIGSVIAAILTGFFLIPNLGVNLLVYTIGAVLLLLASSILFLNKKFLLGLGLLTVTITGTPMLYMVIPNPTTSNAGSLIALKQSPYAEIRVLDYKANRYLLIDGGVHTIVDTMDWGSNYPYVSVLGLAKKFYEQPGDMLLIGLGGGSVVKDFYNDGWNVDAVEIDPVIIEFAYDYFGLRKEEAQVFDMDGRRYLLTTDEKYDVVLLDAFGSSSIPFHLITKEVFDIISGKLNEEGTLAINLETLGWDDVVVTSVAATLKEVFNNVMVLPIGEPPTKLDNIVVIGSNSEFELKHHLKRLYGDPDYRFSGNYYQVHAWDNRFTPDTKDALVLTDNHNPINLWTEKTNYLARINLHKFFKETNLDW